MTLTMWQWLSLVVVSWNLLTFIVYWFDKWMARSHGWRVPEVVLWTLALLGGSIGALAAIEVLHHKNRKLSFQLVIWLILLLQLAGLAGYYWLQFDM